MLSDGPACEHCRRRRPVMVVMEPGADRVPWVLCSSCYLDGLRPMDDVGTTSAPAVETPPPAKKRKRAG